MHTCHKCDLCPRPHPREHKHNPGKPTPGIGALNPRLMIIGEAPGSMEAQAGKPFVGPSGQLLQTLLKELEIDVKGLYITNAVKHRPPENRTPLEQELETCVQYFLGKEIIAVNPRAIICLGHTAANAMAILSTNLLSQETLRDKTGNYQDIPVTASWHPAFCLRYPKHTPELKADLKRALECKQ